ncbi:MAG: 50S ribosomal protein L23 [Dehalococcoidia bacterium]|nr:50S ribosomal protein L23 [Dehalococcoidia bacterium]
MPKEIHAYTVIKRPVVTEKSTALANASQYVFEVDKAANKMQIKDAVEKAFTVRVLDVNTMLMKPKRRRRGRQWGFTRAWKKAIVTLAPGDSITLFEGV